MKINNIVGILLLAVVFDWELEKLLTAIFLGVLLSYRR